MEIEWLKQQTRYSDSHVCMLGKWIVGSVYYDGMVTKGDPCVYKATCLLPGIKDILGHYQSREEAKAVVEKSVMHWAKNAGL